MLAEEKERARELRERERSCAHMNNKSSSNRYTDGAEIGTLRSQAGEEKLVVVERGLPRAPSVCIRTPTANYNYSLYTCTERCPGVATAADGDGDPLQVSPSFSRPQVSGPLSLSLATTSSGRLL